MREQAPQVHHALERALETLPRMAELVMFPTLVEQIVQDLPPQIAVRIHLGEYQRADVLARRILFSLSAIRCRGYNLNAWRGREHANLYAQIEASMKQWEEGSLNWVALKNALHFIDRLLGTLWREHCDHRRTPRSK